MQGNANNGRDTKWKLVALIKYLEFVNTNNY